MRATADSTGTGSRLYRTPSIDLGDGGSVGTDGHLDTRGASLQCGTEDVLGEHVRGVAGIFFGGNGGASPAEFVNWMIASRAARACLREAMRSPSDAPESSNRCDSGTAWLRTRQ